MMINTFADTDTDLYDDFNSKIRRRRKKRRFPQGGRPPRRPRRPPMRFNIKGFPVKIKRYTKQRPKVIKGKPTKLPPIVFQTIKSTGVINPNKAIKTLTVKHTKTPVTKKKIAINELIKKTAIAQKTPKSVTVIKAKAPKTITDTDTIQPVKQTAPTANKKAMESDSKAGKVVKVITGIAIVGLTGFGIYKYIQYRKKQNIHIKK